MTQSLPIKLKKEPLVEAIFEMRFESDNLASNILSGILVSKLKAKLESLPAAQIPEQIKKSDPALTYLPNFRIKIDGYIIFIGDNVFGISNTQPYSGWDKFKNKIMELTNSIKDANVIRNIERFSLKYVNLIESDQSVDKLLPTNVKLTLNGKSITDSQLNLKLEKQNNNNITQILHILSDAEVLTNNQKKQGLLVNIDNIYKGPHKSFWDKRSSDLETIHDENKKSFFSLLSKSTIEKLEPIYE